MKEKNIVYVVASLIFAFFVGMLMNPNLGWLFILEILASVIILLILVLLIAKIWIMKNDGIKRFAERRNRMKKRIRMKKQKREMFKMVYG